jgi:DsbC/DsbD-like thiol-disulfide interchange protein
MKIVALLLVIFSQMAKVAPALEKTPMLFHTSASLISEAVSIAPEESFTVALSLKMKDGWHTYWRNPGDSGMPTSIQWTLPKGFKASAIQWPYPDRFVAPNSVSYGYRDEVVLLNKLDAPNNLPESGSVDLYANVKWLECQEICVPAHAAVSIRLRVGKFQKDTNMASFFEEARKRIPDPLGTGFSIGWKAQAVHNGEKVVLHITAGQALQAKDNVEFFPNEDGIIAYDQHQICKIAGKFLTLEMEKSRAPATTQARRLFGVLVLRNEKRALELSVPINDSWRKGS